MQKAGTLEEYRNRIMKNSYGCSSCPHNGTSSCPYGIGSSTYAENFYISIAERGENVKKLFAERGEPKKTHPKGICPERYAEISTYIQSYNNMSGLQFRRSEMLLQMQDNLSKLNGKIRNFIDKRDGDVLVEDNGDAKLIEAIKEYGVLSHKFVDRLDTAINQEQKKEDARKLKQTMSADDVANLINESEKDLVVNKRKNAAIAKQKFVAEQKAEMKERVERHDEGERIKAESKTSWEDD